MEEITAIQIKGLFSEDDLREIMALLRKIESKHPEANYYLTLLDPELKSATEEAHAMLERIFPRHPEYERQTAIIKLKDPSDN